MGVKIQYNPSTGKVSYNTDTGLVQVVVDTADCGLCNDGMPILKWTTVGMSACCGRFSISQSKALIGPWDQYLNTTFVFDNFFNFGELGCQQFHRVLVPASTIFIRQFTSEIDCTGSFFDTEITAMDYHWGIFPTVVAAQISPISGIPPDLPSTQAAIVTWNKNISDPPWDCVDEEGTDLTATGDCNGPLAFPRSPIDGTFGALTIEVA